MELSIPSTAALEHRGSYSSAKSTLAAGIWTPPHSPTLGDIHMEPEEELPTPTTTTISRPEDKTHREEVPQSQQQQPQQQQEVHQQVVNAQESTSQAVAEAEQTPELRLSDFQVVDTLGEPFAFFLSANNSNQPTTYVRYWHLWTCPTRSLKATSTTASTTTTSTFRDEGAQED